MTNPELAAAIGAFERGDEPTVRRLWPKVLDALVELKEWRDAEAAALVWLAAPDKVPS
jgi:hypothetical protein